MNASTQKKRGAPYCYILQCIDGSYYTGWTSDLDRRLREHNAGRGGRYTRSRRPVELAFYERQPDSLAARRREAAIKKMSRSQKEAMVAGLKRRKRTRRKRIGRRKGGIA